MSYSKIFQGYNQGFKLGIENKVLLTSEQVVKMMWSNLLPHRLVRDACLRATLKLLLSKTAGSKEMALFPDQGFFFQPRAHEQFLSPASTFRFQVHGHLTTSSLLLENSRLGSGQAW